ncbi:uncharacterized protein N7515_002773 [Penicillium bovifimosum]|uniref:F-box domain-containing protein n=1 Tax=Penicillium bovifimosum TaxID=126998 RepID=A0A9W9L9P6_9EURO|nr:uncharacterized protein N7515_002773 [Penicillium bovifimosum]KAJ5143986.1 hypothetical protein N7515_002773 [Penicillium bovifimosum]
MPLADLPNEILLLISSFLNEYADLNAFSQVSHHFYALSNKDLYRALARASPARAIVWAAQKGSEASARKLLEMCGQEILEMRGQEILEMRGQELLDIIADDYQRPIVVAAENGHSHLVKLFLSYCLPYDNTEREASLFTETLNAAIEQGHEAIVRLLLESKVDVAFYRQDKYPAQLLSVAVQYRRLSIVKLLLEHNYYNPSTSKPNEKTPLALAASTRASPVNLEIARLLIEAGADLNTDSSPILEAARSGNMPVMKLFLEQGFDPRKLDELEVLLEFSWPRRRDRAMAALLLSWIDVDHAIASGSIQRCYLLRGAITNRFDDLLKRILENRFVFDESHKLDRARLSICPLKLAVCYGRTRAVKLLLEHGADPNGEAPGIRPIVLAIDRGRDAIARLLRDKGADGPPVRVAGTTSVLRARELRRVRLIQERPSAGWEVCC